MNYIQCEKFTDRFPFTKLEFMYVDTKDYLADKIFIQNKLCVYFGNDYARNDSNYRAVFCKINRKDKDNFISCMKKLENNMILTGGSDYPDFCRELIKNIVFYQKNS